MGEELFYRGPSGRIVVEHHAHQLLSGWRQTQTISLIDGEEDDDTII